MGRYSTNPKGILKIDNNDIILSIERDQFSKVKSYSFGGFNPNFYASNNYKELDEKYKLILEISNNIDIKRELLGTVKTPKLVEEVKFNIEGNLTNLNFRFFIIDGYDVKASNENFVPADEAHGERSGLIKVEPDNLEEIAWKLYPNDGSDEPILKVNDSPEINMINLLQEPIGRALIFQNAFEQILWILKDADEENDWVKRWHNFFRLKGIEIPSTEIKDHDYSTWVEETTSQLSKEWKLFTNYKNTVQGA